MRIFDIIRVHRGAWLRGRQCPPQGGPSCQSGVSGQRSDLVTRRWGLVRMYPPMAKGPALRPELGGLLRVETVIITDRVFYSCI